MGKERLSIILDSMDPLMCYTLAGIRIKESEYSRVLYARFVFAEFRSGLALHEKTRAPIQGSAVGSLTRFPENTFRIEGRAIAKQVREIEPGWLGLGNLQMHWRIKSWPSGRYRDMKEHKLLPVSILTHAGSEEENAEWLESLGA